jgi:hypothetical protein
MIGTEQLYNKRMKKVPAPNRKYFFGEATGLNSDIERHREREKELRERIDSLPEGDPYRKAFEGLLNKLLDSKCDVVSKIGKKKH